MPPPAPEPGPPAEPEPAGPDPAAPRLSRPALWILLLLPCAFLPVWRITFPFVGLWPPAVIFALAALVFARRPESAERRVGWLGFGAAAAAFFGAGIALQSLGIPGETPKMVFEAAPEPSSWPVRILSFVVLGFSIVLHEYAHALSAWLSGDPTAKNAGRLTLNPLPHVDLFGSIILPVLLSLVPGGVVFGWAKPVMVDGSRFRNPRRGRLAVAISGVGANLTLAFLFASLLGAAGILLHLAHPGMASTGFMNPWQETVLSGLPHARAWALLVEALKAGVFLNMILFSLNILPIPPLDGYGFLEGLAPEKARPALAKFRGWGFLLFVGLMAGGVFQYLIIPGGVVAMLLNFLAGAIAKLG